LGASSVDEREGFGIKLHFVAARREATSLSLGDLL
jgi:hypothetical protein